MNFHEAVPRRARAASLLDVVDATGEEIDQGSMLRYLSEMIWFPSAFLEDNVRFEPLDDEAARVVLTDREREVGAILRVEASGRLVELTAERYRMVDRHYELTPWVISFGEHAELGGSIVPVAGKVAWRLGGGDLDYFVVRVSELCYDDEALRSLGEERRGTGPERLRRFLRANPRLLS
jgi:hypothetical protein